MKKSMRKVSRKSVRPSKPKGIVGHVVSYIGNIGRYLTAPAVKYLKLRNN